LRDGRRVDVALVCRGDLTPPPPRHPPQQTYPQWVHGPAAQLLLSYCLLRANENWLRRYRPRSHNAWQSLQKINLQEFIARATALWDDPSSGDARQLQCDVAAVYAAARDQKSSGNRVPSPEAVQVGGEGRGVGSVWGWGG